MDDASRRQQLPSLVPIRVDAWSPDKSARIVDTLLFDPSCWPVPLTTTTTTTTVSSATSKCENEGGDGSSSASASCTSRDRLLELVEDNARYMADQILSDAEVTGMGRTVRHFTNRIELISTTTTTSSSSGTSLRDAIADQIRTQLAEILAGRLRRGGSTTRLRRTLKVPGIAPASKSDEEDDDTSSNKRPRADSIGSSDRKEGEGSAAAADDDAAAANDGKRRKLNPEDEHEGDASKAEDPSLADKMDVEDEDSKPQQEQSPDDAKSGEAVEAIADESKSEGDKEGSGATPSAEASALKAASDVRTALREMKSAIESTSSQCRRIRLRIANYTVRVHDDFYWDPTFPYPSLGGDNSKKTVDYTSPIHIAQSIGEELNLPDETVVAIATDIAEQAHGMVVGDAEYEAKTKKDDDDEFYALLIKNHQEKLQEQQPSKAAGQGPSDEGAAGRGKDGTTSEQPTKRKMLNPRTTTAAWTIDYKTHVANVAQLAQIMQQPKT